MSAHVSGAGVLWFAGVIAVAVALAVCVGRVLREMDRPPPPPLAEPRSHCRPVPPADDGKTESNRRHEGFFLAEPGSGEWLDQEHALSDRDGER